MFIEGGQEEKRLLIEALSRYNYFPNQRLGLSELPPSFDSRQFTPEVLTSLVKLQTAKVRQTLGYSLTEYRSTRFNNIPRLLGIIHPKAYSHLASCIHENWDEIRKITKNHCSQIKPTFHHNEKRLLVMNYDDPSEKIRRALCAEFTKRFRVHADISNCFHSIYTHAIPWAIVGVEESKRRLKENEKKSWPEYLDFHQRRTKRNETQGIPIGPATSSILVEVILQSVDEALNRKGYHFIRYIDDYTCYCDTNEHANDFILDLENYLSIYKLTLNLKKTWIETLPAPTEDEWILTLISFLPSRLANEHDGENKLTTSETLTFINQAIRLNKTTPDGSVLKYAISIILNYIDDYAAINLLDYVINLSWHYPVLVPLIDRIIDLTNYPAEQILEQLNKIIDINALSRRSDGMCWPLHIMLKHNLTCDESTADEIIKSQDCAALSLLLEQNEHNNKIIDFTNKIVSSDIYTKDNYWLLLYQMYYKGIIDAPYQEIEENAVFKTLKQHNVNFIPRNSKTKHEEKCDEILRKIQTEQLKDIFSNTSVEF